ncbi:MAG: hypothetical protein M1816_000322 [Peltula sp. TS41687]|nr:MAG: hypothetical protein M1816_000322 [Peltula sp. TS41687]
MLRSPSYLTLSLRRSQHPLPPSRRSLSTIPAPRATTTSSPPPPTRPRPRPRPAAPPLIAGAVPLFPLPQRRIKTYPPPPSTAARARNPIDLITSAQLRLLDRRGTRTRLFARDNPEAAKVGDILLVRQRSGDPFAGVLLSVRRRGVDTAILLRNELMRTAVEMWFKIYSPNVEGIEVVQRRLKRARRARLYYMRQKKHDVGSVQNIVTQYLKRKALLGMVTGAGRRGKKEGDGDGEGKGKGK